MVFIQLFIIYGIGGGDHYGRPYQADLKQIKSCFIREGLENHMSLIFFFQTFPKSYVVAVPDHKNSRIAPRFYNTKLVVNA